MTIELQTVEEQIAKALIRTLLDACFTIGVNDGEDTTLKQSTNADAIFKATRTTDEDWLLVYRGATHFGWVRLIYGNGRDLISDYTTNLDAVLEPLNKAINEKFM